MRFRCECSRGFVDRSDDPKLTGRVCEPAQPPTPPPRKFYLPYPTVSLHYPYDFRIQGYRSYTVFLP